jgi:hypothetical protein
MVRSFVQIIFFLPLCCRNSDRSFVWSFDRSSDRSWFVCPFVRSFIVRPFVRPNNFFPAVMLPKFQSFVRPTFVRSFMVRSSDRPIVRSFVQIILFLPLCCQNSNRLFVRSFDRSSFVQSSYSSFIVRSYELFTITIYRYYPPLLFTVTIHRYYLPSLFIITIYRYYLPSLFTITIYHYYLPLLFIDHPITPNFNYSSIMLSSPPKTSQTHIPVIQTLVTVIFLPVGTSHLVTHPRFPQVEHA